VFKLIRGGPVPSQEVLCDALCVWTFSDGGSVLVDDHCGRDISVCFESHSTLRELEDLRSARIHLHRSQLLCVVDIQANFTLSHIAG
jgi:hypothetical protein